MKTTENQNKSKRSYAGLIGITTGLIVIAVIYVFAFEFLYNVLYIDDPERAGQFGDMFGSVNSLFSALAFLVISISLYLQNRELKLQRKQLELQMDEAKEARTGNLKAQEAQRKEMELTRELHAKNNFEAKLMFLLKNLERQISIAKGEFVVVGSKYGTIEFNGYSYFNHLYTELTTLVIQSPKGGRIFKISGNDFANSLFVRYGLFDNEEYWRSIHIEEATDYTRTIIRLVHNSRKTEYYNSWLTFRTILKILRSEHANWLKASFGTNDEINHNFETYVELLKSAMPFAARIYYLYLNLLDEDDECNDFIYKKMYEEVQSADFFDVHHKKLLFNTK